MPTPRNVTFFENPAALRKWFRGNHARAEELWVGFYKKGTGRPSVTWPESVDEALCVGWIDGIRKSLDAERYAIRFTPRRKGSIWSAVNIARMKVLAGEKRVRPQGQQAFDARIENKVGIYAYEQRRAELEEPYAGMLRRHKAAAEFFDRQPASYRKTISWWINSAKKEETRLARVQHLIEISAKGQRLR